MMFCIEKKLGKTIKAISYFSSMRLITVRHDKDNFLTFLVRKITTADSGKAYSGTGFKPPGLAGAP